MKVILQRAALYQCTAVIIGETTIGKTIGMTTIGITTIEKTIGKRSCYGYGSLQLPKRKPHPDTSSSFSEAREVNNAKLTG